MHQPNHVEDLFSLSETIYKLIDTNWFQAQTKVYSRMKEVPAILRFHLALSGLAKTAEADGSRFSRHPTAFLTLAITITSRFCREENGCLGHNGHSGPQRSNKGSEPPALHLKTEMTNHYHLRHHQSCLHCYHHCCLLNLDQQQHHHQLGCNRCCFLNLTFPQHLHHNHYAGSTHKFHSCLCREENGCLDHNGHSGPKMSNKGSEPPALHLKCSSSNSSRYSSTKMTNHQHLRNHQS